MTLTDKISSINYKAFIWHGVFLSLASSFIDIDTIIPSMIIQAGGSSILLGLLTAIMIGGSSLMQIIFASFLSNKNKKKNYLLLAINTRVFILFSFSALFVASAKLSGNTVIILIFILISIFSMSGAFANVSYMDIFGKSILSTKRKHFFSVKQTISSIGIFLSAILVRHLITLYDYPANYSLLFTMAASLLLIASLGFWRINEVESNISQKLSLKEYLKKIPSEIKTNRNLKYYLLTINSLGLAMSFIPFILLYAKENFGMSNSLIGNILILKISGMLLTSIVLMKYSRKYDYKKLIIFSFSIALSLPILSLILKNNIIAYQMIFVLAGIFVASFRIAVNGILVEISTNENRATYTGISGAGNILPTVFPLVSGIMITFFGFLPTFLLLTILIGTSFYFIIKLDCR